MVCVNGWCTRKRLRTGAQTSIRWKLLRGAILSSGSDWTESSAAPVFTLGGKVIDVPVSENIQGLVTLPLDAAAAFGKRTESIERKVPQARCGVVL